MRVSSRYFVTLACPRVEGLGCMKKLFVAGKDAGGSSVVLSDLQVLRTRHAVMSQACVIKLQHKDLKTYKCDL